MVTAIHSSTEQLLSVSQFAAREGVTRARVLQLLGAGRIAGAGGAGHQWVIPAAVRIVRRAPGRPKKARPSSGDAFLRRMGGKYVWWLTPGEALKRRALGISQGV